MTTATAKVTRKAVIEFAKANGLKAKWNSEWSEWTIGTVDAPEADYYTGDNSDALDQLSYLVANRPTA